VSGRRPGARSSRRKFLAGTGAAAALGFPAIAAAQGPVTLRWQSSWPAGEILNEYAVDFARKVNEMAGGDLRIEMLPVGSVVPQLGLLEAVNKGGLDGAHGLLNNHYHRHAAFALWGASPAFGMDANTLLAWHKYGGGRALLAKVYAALGVNVVSFLSGPMPTQPLGWFGKRIAKAEDFKGLRFRAIGMSIETFAGLGALVNALPAADIASAIERGVLDGGEFNNATSDRALGLSRVAKTYMLQSYHQNTEQLEILVNRVKFEALPPKLRAIIENAAEAASADMSWKAIDRYSRDYQEVRARDQVQAHRTPDAVLQRQLQAYDAAARKRQGDALFREIEASQRQFAERAVQWLLDTQVSPRLAYNHYFSRKAATPPRKKS
jgi:TRAP-type mannitol/chloroaromatic compound transport system substrate-binding protein